MKVGIRSPIKMRKTNSLKNDSLQVTFEHFDLVIEVINDLGFLLLVDADPTAAHLEGGGLQGLGELVGLVGDVVELGFHPVEAFAGDAAVEAVVNLVALPLVEEIGGEGFGGVDYAHCYEASSRVSVVSIILYLNPAFLTNSIISLKAGLF